jgi:hypothetical protein
MGTQASVEQTVIARAKGEAPLRDNAALLALLEGVKPGSTFWMVGDKTLLSNMPKAIPGPGGPGTSQSIELPALKSLTVTGDLEPQVTLDITGEAADEPAAKNLADVVRGFVALASLQANQKPELKQLASAISVTTEASRVHVAARVPYEVIDSLQPKRRVRRSAPSVALPRRHGGTSDPSPPSVPSVSLIREPDLDPRALEVVVAVHLDRAVLELLELADEVGRGPVAQRKPRSSRWPLQPVPQMKSSVE